MINQAEDNCMKLCGPNETKPNAITINPHKRESEKSQQRCRAPKKHTYKSELTCSLQQGRRSQYVVTSYCS